MNDSLSAPATYSLAQRAILASVALGGMLVPLSSTMIAVALPEIMRTFDADLRAAGWLVTAYLVTMATLQLVTGQLGDRFGRRRLVLSGFVYFGLASLVAALAPSLLLLLFARVQQAIAGSILVTNGFALVFEAVPEDRRGGALGLVTAVIVLAAAAGPPLGGLLVGLGSWRAIFWVNVPLVIVAFLLGWTAMAEEKPQQSTSLLDWHDILFMMRNQTLVCANGALMFSNLAMYVILLGIPLLMSTESGWSSLQTGLLLAAMSLTIAVFSPLGGRLSDHSGRRMPSIAGFALLTLGALQLALSGGVINIALLIVALSLVGMGLGLSSTSLQTAVLEAAKPQHAGAATGISSTSRYLGSIVGANVLARSLGSAPIAAANFRLVFLAVTAAAGIGLLLSWGIQNEVQKPT